MNWVMSGLFAWLGKALASAFTGELSLVNAFIDNTTYLFGGSFGKLLSFNAEVIPALAMVAFLAWLVGKGLSLGGGNSSFEQIFKRVIGSMIISLLLSIMIPQVVSLISALDSRIMSITSAGTNGLASVLGSAMVGTAIVGGGSAPIDVLMLSVIVLGIGLVLAALMIFILLLAHAAVFLIVYFAPYIVLFKKDGFHLVAEGAVAALSMPFVITSVIAVGITVMGATGTLPSASASSATNTGSNGAVTTTTTPPTSSGGSFACGHLGNCAKPASFVLTNIQQVSYVTAAASSGMCVHTGTCPTPPVSPPTTSGTSLTNGSGASGSSGGSTSSSGVVTYLTDAFGGLLILASSLILPKMVVGMIFQHGGQMFNAMHQNGQDGVSHISGRASKGMSKAGEFLDSKLNKGRGSEAIAAMSGGGASSRSNLVSTAVNTGKLASVGGIGGDAALGAASIASLAPFIPDKSNGSNGGNGSNKGNGSNGGNGSSKGSSISDPLNLNGSNNASSGVGNESQASTDRAMNGMNQSARPAGEPQQPNLTDLSAPTSGQQELGAETDADIPSALSSAAPLDMTGDASGSSDLVGMSSSPPLPQQETGETQSTTPTPRPLTISETVKSQARGSLHAIPTFMMTAPRVLHDHIKSNGGLPNAVTLGMQLHGEWGQVKKHHIAAVKKEVLAKKETVG